MSDKLRKPDEKMSKAVRVIGCIAIGVVACALMLFAVVNILVSPHVRSDPGKAIYEANNAKDPAQFVFDHRTISSWREVEDGFSIKLSEIGKEEMFETTRQNVGKPVNMYVGTLLVMSPIVREPIGGGSAMLAADDEMKQKILPILPERKKEE